MGNACWKTASRISIWIPSWKLFLVLMSASSKIGKKTRESEVNHDWSLCIVRRANGALLPIMKRKRNDDDDNGIMDDGDDNNTEADVDNNRDVAETVYKPDWAVFANGNPVITVIGTLELEALYKRNPGYVSDYVKLAKK